MQGFRLFPPRKGLSELSILKGVRKLAADRSGVGRHQVARRQSTPRCGAVHASSSVITGPVAAPRAKRLTAAYY